MISSISVKATISDIPQFVGNLSDPSRAAFFRNLAESSKSCSSHVLSHITGAPIGFAIRAPRGNTDQLTVSFSLPVARSLVGQGLLHGWTECFDDEKAMVLLQIKKIVTEQGFTPEEASMLVADAHATSTSLVWHIEMNDRVTAQDLLKRAVHQVKVLRDHNNDDFYGIQDYVFTNTSTEVSLQIVLSSGNGLRLSIQPEYLAKYTELHIMQNVSAEPLLAMAKTKIMVEATVGWQLLERWVNGSPWEWSGASLESSVDSIWTQAGFSTKFVPYPAKVCFKGYPPGPRAMLRWYQLFKGLDETYEDFLYDALIKSGFDLHLRPTNMPLSGSKEEILYDPEMQDLDGEPVTNFHALLLRDGIDLRVRPSEHKYLDGSIGEKLHYSNHWQVPGGMQDLIVSTRTRPGLTIALSEAHHQPRQEVLKRDTSPPSPFSEWTPLSTCDDPFKNRYIRKSKRISI